jgi:hypothetical protein
VTNYASQFEPSLFDMSLLLTQFANDWTLTNKASAQTASPSKVEP